MKTFIVYEHKHLPTEIVKDGWGWPAFFFVNFWAFFKNMWVLGLGVTFAYWAILAIQINERGAQNLLDGFGASYLEWASFLSLFIFGHYGNGWRMNHLVKRGYKREREILARNFTHAEAMYNASPKKVEEASSEPDSEDVFFKEKSTESAAIKYTDVKIDKSDGSSSKKKTQDSDEASENSALARFNAGYKEVLSSDIASEKDSNKVTPEEVEVIDSEAPVSDVSSDTQSSYIGKLKEAKMLLDDGIINEDDYEIIKKKVIDEV